MNETAILLDTHVAIWLAEARLPAATMDRVLAAAEQRLCLLSPVTAWEVGILARRGRYEFRPDPRAWLRELLGGPIFTLAPLTAEILLESSLLPEPLHADPADRMLIATARANDCHLLTRDALILDYAAQGLVKAIAC